jgi:hypothetical protein
MMPRLASSAIVMVALAVQPGCIAHVARVLPAESSKPGTTLFVASRQVDPEVGETVRQSLPIDLTVTAYEPGDGFARCEDRVLTPTPWWQRFPVDLVTDFLPMTFEAAASRRVAYAPVPVRSEDDVFQEARSLGFAHDLTPPR